VKRDSQPVIHSFSLAGHSGTTPTIHPSVSLGLSQRSGRIARAMHQNGSQAFGAKCGALKKTRSILRILFSSPSFF